MIILAAMAAMAVSNAKVRLPAVIGDNMLLQHQSSV